MLKVDSLRTLCGTLAFAFVAMSAGAQTSAQTPQLPANPRAPVATRMANIVSPEIQPDGKVTFRFFDPAAQRVLLSLQSLENPVPMEKGANGVWSVTVGPLTPEYYTYSFVVDRVSATDPSNPLSVTGLKHAMSVLYVPGPASLPWQVNDVPHGVIHHEFYHSKVVGDDRDFYVYTPPDYNPQGKKRYPVLYLLHGAGQTAHAWTAINRANVILDNLIAHRKAVPMIVVMPLGYGYSLSQILPLLRSHAASSAMILQNSVKFAQSLLTEVMPRVKKSYRVLRGPRSTAIAGGSMGGGEALFAGLNHLHQFGWIGGFKAAGIFNFNQLIPNLSATANSQLRLLWLACGDHDPLAGPTNVRLRSWLKIKGIRFTESDYPGTHGWRADGKDTLAEFLPLLF